MSMSTYIVTATESLFEAIPECPTITTTPEMFEIRWSGFVDKYMNEVM